MLSNGDVEVLENFVVNLTPQEGAAITAIAAIDEIKIELVCRRAIMAYVRQWQKRAGEEKVSRFKILMSLYYEMERTK